MKKKTIIAIAVLLIGVTAIIYGIHSRGRVQEARGNIHTLTSPFSGRKETGYFKRGIDSKLDRYDMQIRWLFIGGAILIAVGGGLLYTNRKR